MIPIMQIEWMCFGNNFSSFETKNETLLKISDKKYLRGYWILELFIK